MYHHQFLVLFSPFHPWRTSLSLMQIHIPILMVLDEKQSNRGVQSSVSLHLLPQPVLEQQQRADNPTQQHISEILFFFIHHAFYPITEHISCFIHSRGRCGRDWIRPVWSSRRREKRWHRHSEHHSISNLQCCTHKLRAVGTKLHRPLHFCAWYCTSIPEILLGNCLWACSDQSFQLACGYCSFEYLAAEANELWKCYNHSLKQDNIWRYY